MKEVIRPDVLRAEGGTMPHPLTDLLDPSGKPYLVQEVKTGRFFILYWKAQFKAKKRGKGIPQSWIGSDWYDTPDCKRMGFRKQDNYPSSDPIRIWELPGVKYAPPTNYTGEKWKVAEGESVHK